MHLTPAEIFFIEKFFDSVANAISARMTDGSNVGEEILTFLLCEMMAAQPSLAADSTQELFVQGGRFPCVLPLKRVVRRQCATQDKVQE